MSENAAAAKRRRRKAYRHHVRRTLATLGTFLLVAVAIGLSAEANRRATGAQPTDSPLAYSSLRATLTLAFRSFQASIPVVAALVAVPLLVARLVRDLHGTGTINEAHDRLNHLLFGALAANPRVLVKEGKVASGQDSVIKRVGGPASLTVYDDSAVVTEQCGRVNRVLDTGTYTLDHYERIWKTVDLRQQRWVRRVFALTKEGIPICCDVDFLFRIDTSDGFETAVLRAATSASTRREDGDVRTVDWAERIALLMEETIRDVLATYRLDWLIKAPQSEQPHPRDEIHGRLRDELSDDVRELGAILLDVDLGEIRVSVQDATGYEDEDVSETLSDIISDQWIEAWHANWRARALTSRAEGEAELLRMDTARIEAQAEMLIGLAEALQPVTGDTHASEPYVKALRLIEALHWMSYDPKTRDYMPPEAIRTLQRLQHLLSSDLSVSSAATETGESET